MYFMRFHFFFVIAVYLAQPFVVSAENEPACSPFDYEEKLLAKMIRTEIKFEQLLDDIEKIKDTMASIAADMSERMEDAENKAVKFQGEIEETVKNIAGDLERAKGILTSTAEAVSVPLVAFSARMSSSPTVSTSDVIVFDTILTNEGEGYDKATGIFTAPQSGLYYFAAHLCNNANKEVYYAIVVEDKKISSTAHQDKNNEYSCSFVSTVAIVKSSDRVLVQSTSTSHIFTNNYRWNTFAGVLLNR